MSDSFNPWPKMVSKWNTNDTDVQIWFLWTSPVQITPTYQWRKNGNNVGTNSVSYTDATLANGDKITCVMTSSDPCASPTTARSNEITMTICTPPTAINITGRGSCNKDVMLGSSEFGVTYQFRVLIPSWQPEQKEVVPTTCQVV